MLRIEKQRMVENWNRKFIPGQKVKVKLDSGTEKVTTTKTNAELLGGHTPAIFLEGISGCYALDRVTPIQ